MEVTAKGIEIGNLFSIPVTKKIVELVGIERIDNGHIPIISDFKSEYKVSWLSLNGVPLTEEILLKCGFEKELSTNGKSFYKFEDMQTDLKTIWIGNNEFYISEVPLHRLQNIHFAIYNEELEINL